MLKTKVQTMLLITLLVNAGNVLLLRALILTGVLRTRLALIVNVVVLTAQQRLLVFTASRQPTLVKLVLPPRVPTSLEVL